MIRKNFQNISYQAIAQIVPKAIMFLFVMYLAKSLGGTEYGKYEFALSLGYIIGMFFELGGNMILTKHVARDFYSSIYFALKIRISSILITLLLFYGILLISGIYSELLVYLIYSGIGIAFSSLMNLYFAFFRGAGVMKYEVWTLIIQKVLFISAALLLMMYSRTGSSVLLSFAISMFAAFIIIYTVFRKNESFYLKKDKQHPLNFRDYLKDVLSLALVEIFASIYFRLNQVFLEYFRGFEEVSTYAVAYRIIEVFTSIPGILLLALFPSFAKLAVSNIEEFRIQFYKILKYLFVLGITSALICWFGGEYIFGLLGSDYKSSYIILRYLSFPLVFLFPNYLVTQGLIALNKNLIFARILLAALLLNIILSLMLVPALGAAGSAISIGICEVLIFISGFYYINKTTRS